MRWATESVEELSRIRAKVSLARDSLKLLLYKVRGNTETIHFREMILMVDHLDSIQSDIEHIENSIIKRAGV